MLQARDCRTIRKERFVRQRQQTPRFGIVHLPADEVIQFVSRLAEQRERFVVRGAAPVRPLSALTHTLDQHIPDFVKSCAVVLQGGRFAS
jgi:hypothetical protein